MSPSDDDRLMARVAADDFGAHESLCRKHLQLIHKIAYSKGLSLEDSEEIVSLVFEAIWTGAKTYRAGSGSGVRAWIAGIAHNKVKDRLQANRSRGRWVAPFCTGDDGEDGDDADQHRSEDYFAADPALVLEAEQVRTCIKACIDALSDTLRAVMLQSTILGMKEEEIAAGLGIPLNTVKSRKFAARKQLDPCLADCSEALR